jgi:hypothetical protein
MLALSPPMLPTRLFFSGWWTKLLMFDEDDCLSPIVKVFLVAILNEV